MKTTDGRGDFNLHSEKGDNKLLYIRNNKGGVNVKTDEGLLQVIDLLSQFLREEQEREDKLFSLIEELILTKHNNRQKTTTMKTYLEITSYDPKSLMEKASRQFAYPEALFTAIADIVDDLRVNNVLEDLFGGEVQEEGSPDGNSLTIKGRLFSLKVRKRTQYEGE